ncbi:hypothetical protein AMS68_007592 [Peltaster fructicola]|uniref:HMG box domain-containing protein n=1 Tax=Peltaster fructicola TaxID=286661 RepID=A0A6H0Y589_9PEZI|nr:hypothetical protein AMS68_007592 [Peltaster fructicola]
MTISHTRAADEYGLSAIAQHNASEAFPAFDDGPKGFGIYDEFVAAYHDTHNPPTPRSTTASEGMRTRSGRSTRRADSPFSTTKSRVSKSPAPRTRQKKSKLDKSKTPKLTAPLSVLTKDMNVPVKDMDLWVNRPIEVRRQEVEKRNGYVTRPMNSFMLYRSAYADRTKQWCLQNNHQVVSSVSGESWPMEPSEIRDQFNEWAKIERANHALAHPDYKFSPSKANTKKRKGEDSDEDDESIDLDDPDGDYRGPKGVRQRKHVQTQSDLYLPSHHGYETIPYYGQQTMAYEVPQYAYVAAGRPLPSNVAYDQRAMHGGYVQLAVQPPASYQHAVDLQPHHAPSPQSLGGYGVPGSQAEDIFGDSHHGTPIQAYNQYTSQGFGYGQRLASSYPATSQQLLEHQQYLQAQLQPQHGIDPALNIAFTEASAAQLHGIPIESHFDNAFGELGAEYVYTGPHSDVDTTLAPPWSPTDALQ